MARPTISLQAAIGPGTVATNVFIIGTSLIGGSDVLAGGLIVGQGTWAELGDYCDNIAIRRGRQRQLEQYPASTFAGSLDNRDRRFDPTWTAGPYTEAGVSNITTDRAVKVVATYLGVDYDLFYGFTDDFSPTYEYPEGGRAKVTATDAFKIFNNIDPLEQASQGAGEATGARVNRILDLAGWSSTLRDIDTGNATHSATTMAEPIISQLRLAVDSERGDLYIAPNSYVTMRERRARLTLARSRYVQYIFGDGDGELNPAGFQTTNDDQLKRNDVNVARAGGSIITRQDSVAVATPYLRKSYTRTDLTLADDTQVTDYADWILHLFATQKPRVDYVDFEPDGYDNLWPVVLGARFGDRVTCNLTHPYDGSRWSGDYFIEGIEHDIPVVENSGVWRTRFYLADATGFPTNPFIIGLSLIGGTDVLS